ncbi:MULTISPECIES: TIGR02302 family protein [Roseobacteraceae]|uniref:ATPase n=1 Tax=Pseudosulfitobacter pseudonitzschiae TaxID=1402135 RepID=A0A221JWV0_9RHOB|nr:MULTISPECIES: TIGR02302 family protein [Roseobacteraceae]ASM71209.1 ATPase [Pseudosulfitobacter pseudonitzschiae]
MANSSRPDTPAGLRALRWPLRLTWAGMLAENLSRALWPLLAVVFTVLAMLMLGLHDIVLIEVVWSAAVLSGLAAAAALVYAFRQFRLPTWAQALTRLDASLPGRPIQALMDDQAIGLGDAASAAVWAAHQKRMAARASQARAVPGDLRVARYDPFALRYVALLAFVVALLFGSIWRVGTVTEMTPGGGGLATGPVWEGWAESPRYTGLPTIYLNDIPQGTLKLPVGSLITLRLYGEVGALTVSETVSGRVGDVPPASGAAHDFTVTQSGDISVNGPGGRNWQVAVVPDDAPSVLILDDPERAALGEMTLPFSANDDYGVEAGEARIALDLANVDRIYGLIPEPEDRPEIIVPLPMPIAGDRRAFEENLVEDFSEHPWANLPVTITLSVLDAAEQQTQSVPREITLPGRRFFDPLAAAIIEMRRDLLWNRSNAERSAQVLRAISYRPDEVFRKETRYLKLRQAIRQMETLANYGMNDEQQQALADDLWKLAIELEEGDLADALDRMRQAQERLEQAMREGASEAEIAELMNELRRATEDYLKQLGEQAQREAEQNGDQQQGQQDGMQMTQDDLQRMMDRIQELMEQGRMAEAEEALRELQEMMENMRVTQGQGQNGQSPGEQAMEGLSETLRDQQGLSDEAFRDLQEQFNPDAQAGESQGNRGRSGSQGEGQQHSQGEGGEGSEGAQNGDQRGQGAEQGGGSLADRQQALRDELNRQQGNMPGAGTPEGDAAREALDRAGRAMEGAEEALRNGDNAGAIDNQAQAMEALREGMRALGEAMAQEERDSQPGQGTAQGDRRAEARDPLGRTPGANGGTGTEEGLLQGEDVYRRARELLDEIRRRSAQGERPEVELDYLERLLDRF